MSEQSNDKSLTLKDEPTLCLSGLLGRTVKSQMVTTKNGPKLKVNFNLGVDMGKGPDGKYLPVKYIRCSAWGDFAQVLESYAALGVKAKIAVSGKYNARPERVANDGKVWPASIEFDVYNVFTLLDPETSVSNTLRQATAEALPF